MTKHNPARALMAAAALAATALAGCSRHDDDAPPLENVAEDNAAAIDAPLPVENLPDAVETAPVANDTVALPPEEPARPDEQMLDDASATGMTARAQRDKQSGEEQPDGEQGGEPAPAATEKVQ